MLKVFARNRFSDRNGLEKFNLDIQTKEIDEITKTKILNALSDLLTRIDQLETHPYNPHLLDLINTEVFKEAYNELIGPGNYVESNIAWIEYRDTISEDSLNYTFDLLEIIVAKANENLQHYIYSGESIVKSFINQCNKIFEREFVGYRFTNSEIIVPISDEMEIGSINQALSNPYEPVREHLKVAANHLANRKHPNYADSIKGSILAIETLCQIVTNVDRKDATLGKMLSLIEKKIPLNGAFKAALSSLYGYTSDSNGIRHSGDYEAPKPTFAEAKFMLVTCSAFLNYIIEINECK